MTATPEISRKPALGFDAPVAAVNLDRASLIQRYGRPALVAAQLALILVVFNRFALEASSGIGRILPVILGGFIVHAIAPSRVRLPIFVLVALAAFGIALGPPAVVVVVLALAVVGICHLPVAFGIRVAAIAAIGAALAAMSIAESPLLGRFFPGKTFPVLGSMLMFRTIIYMYDLRHERGDVSPWMRVAYFFLPPNVCFLLFPLVDFQAFRSTYYNRPSFEIYQKGVSWMFRGVTHLLLYRMVYYYLSPDPAAVASVGGVAVFIVTSWLLYLHVSGVFHVAVGSLALFGFNLPETHRLYFLASSPSDVWRRANIYWKNFMMKVFYYPFYKALQKRGLGMQSSIVVATLGVFAATWFLHSYQWFWLLGHFPLSLIHVAFWTVFALLVLASTLLELRKGRVRTLKSQPWTVRAALVHTLKVMSMFTVMAVMWSWWNSGDTGDWLYLLGMAGESDAREWLTVGAWLVVAVLAGVSAHFITTKFRIVRLDADTPFGQSAAITTAGTLVLLLAVSPIGDAVLPERPERILSSLQTESLNAHDRKLETRSYYEAIITSEQAGPLLAISTARTGSRSRVVAFRETEAVRQTGDYRSYELLPSRTTIYRSDTIVTNRWGMRDRDYALAKPPGTWRAAIVGASIVMGYKTQGKSFEALVEERFNREKPVQGIDSFEFLNFAANGYSLMQFVWQAEHRAPAFDPDVLILATIGEELQFTRDQITRVVTAGVPLPPFVADVAQRAGVRRSTKQWSIQRRLATGSTPFELHARGYREIADAARQRGIIPVWIYLPSITKVETHGEYELLSRAARDAGFLEIDLRDAFVGVDSTAISLPGDLLHPNVLGHEIIARRLYDALLANRDKLGMKLPLSTTH
jgi:hypothetical protein